MSYSFIVKTILNLHFSINCDKSNKIIVCSLKQITRTEKKIQLLVMILMHNFGHFLLILLHTSF